jgi:hypothetical protein
MKHIIRLGIVILRSSCTGATGTSRGTKVYCSLLGHDCTKMSLDDGATLLLGVLLIVGTGFAFALYMIFSHRSRGR